MFLTFIVNYSFSQIYEGISNEAYNFEIGVPNLVIDQNSVTFQDSDGNQIIDADEKCKLIFTVENKGSSASSVVSDISLTNFMSGINFSKSQSIGTINKNEKKQIVVDISSNNQISTGSVEFNIKVKDASGKFSNNVKLNVETMAYIPPELKVIAKDVENIISEQLVAVTEDMRQKNIISDQVSTNVMAVVKEEMNEQGISELNLSVTYQYEVKKNEAVVTSYDKQTDDFAPGAYLLKSSQAARIIMSVMKTTVESELDDYLLAGKKVTIKITGSTDATPVKSKIPYGGEYGELVEQEYYLNGLFDYISVTSAGGITSNAQLAFLRTYAVRDFIEKNISPLKITDNTFEHYAIISNQVGSEFRRISVELTIHDAFAGKTDDNSDDIYKFIPFCEIDKNIPVSNKNSNIYALIIGNEDYKKFQSNLSDAQNVPFAVHDALTFKEYALNTFGVTDDNLKIVLNATAGEMNSAITWLTEKVQNAVASNQNPQIIFYYAGHGVPDNDSVPYLMPVDVTVNDLSLAVKLPDLYLKLSNTKAQKITVFLDACFSGGARNQNLFEGARVGIRRTPKEGTIPQNIVVFSATSENQSAWAYESKKHGIFTYFLLKKIQETQGNINYLDLYDYLKFSVNDKAIDLNKPNQQPQVNISQNIENLWKNFNIK